MSPAIVWNGPTGTVGRTALRYFLRRWGDDSSATAAQSVTLELRLTGRSAERLEAVAADVRVAYPQHTVVVYPGCDAQTAPTEWPGKPLEGATLLVNTAGPGYLVTSQLVRYCIDHNLAYVDPSGDHKMVSEIVDDVGAKADELTVPVILGAGIQPGLSGIMVRLLARAAGPGATVELYSGGAQPTTEAAVQEFVDSVHSGMLWAGKEWVDGELRPSRLPEDYLARVAAGFSTTAVAHAHCDQEVAAAAAAAQTHIVRWHNISDAPKTTIEIQKMIAGDATVEQVMEAARMDDFGRRHYFRMEGKAVPAGTPDGPLEDTTATPGDTWYATLDCVDSFLVTASVTALAAEYALQKAHHPDPAARGVTLPVDLPDTDSWWEAVMDDPATVTTSLASGEAAFDEEEGELS